MLATASSKINLFDFGTGKVILKIATTREGNFLAFLIISFVLRNRQLSMFPIEIRRFTYCTC